MALPMSVFSQSNLEESQEIQIPSENLETSSIQEVSVIAETISDPYKREKLPGNGEVYSDFVVGPGRFALELAPGESQTVEVIVSNRMGVPKRFSIETEDTAGTSDPSQSLVLLGEDTGPYTVKDYIQVPNREFDLDHSYRARIPVTVSLPQDASPGGHYGSMLISMVSDPNENNEEEEASTGSVIVSRIGILFFVSNPGDTTHSAELKDFSTIGGQTFFADGPIDFAITHENNADVHVTPYGEVRISNMLGDEVGFVKLDPWFVLPQSLRTREVSWERELLIGRYTAHLQVNRGYDDIIDDATVVFWVLPWKILLTVFSALFVFFLLIRFVSTRFEFKKK